MVLKRLSLRERIFVAVLVILVLAMLAYAVYVGLTPPESSEPIEPYNIQQLTPASTVTVVPK